MESWWLEGMDPERLSTMFRNSTIVTTKELIDSDAVLGVDENGSTAFMIRPSELIPTGTTIA
jgi:hypothetical protein